MKNNPTNKQTNKFFNLNVFSIALSSLGFLAISQTSYAACNSDSINNQLIICEGTDAANTPNLHSGKTLINRANIEQIGNSYLFYAHSNNAGGNISVSNEGNITWTAAKGHSRTTEFIAPINLYFDNAYNKNIENLSVVNQASGLIDITVDPNVLRTGPTSVAGIVAYGHKETKIENEGTIRVRAGQLDARGMVGVGENVKLHNSGIIDIQGDSFSAGIIANLEYAKNAEIVNTGSIDSSGSELYLNAAIALSGISSALESVDINNAGNITTHTPAVGIYIAENTSDNESTIVKITNSGTIDVSKNGAVAIYSSLGMLPTHIYNSGKIINIPSSFAVAATDKDDIFAQTSGETVGILYFYEGNDQLLSSGGKFVGSIYLGEGNDYAEFKNTDMSDLTILDGAYETQSIPELNTLVLNQDLTGSSSSTGEQNNTQIKNWNIVHIGRDQLAKLNLTGNLLSGSVNSELGQMIIGSQGTLALNVGTTTAELAYHLNNSGNIDLTQGATTADGKLTIQGDYQGESGSTLEIKSTWNNPDEQSNDQLVIKGAASGQTTVKVRNNTIDGDVIREKIEKNGGWLIPVVVVEGGDAGNTVFTGIANTSGASQAQLTRKEENGVVKYSWTLKAVEPTTPATPTSPELVEPTKPVLPAPTVLVPTEYDIYAKPVSAYVLQPYINQQMGLSQLGQLHQRVGEQYKSGLDNTQVWGRLNVDSENLQGANRFGAKIRSGFVQFGKDLSFKLNEDQSHRHIGLTATYGWANTSFYDKYNAKNGEISADKFTGKSKTDMFSVGGYHTDYSASGWYLDRVAQLSWISNHYKSEQNTHQTGWGLGASVEMGKAYPLPRNPNWSIEPQAQLSYQWVKLGNANDGVRQIQGNSQHNLTARLGTRLTWNKNEKENQAQAYLGTHFIQTLIGRSSEVKIGRDNIQENMNGLSLAFDLGGQYPITKNLSVYGDIRYQFSLDNHHNSVYRDSQLARESYNGRVGLRYTW